MRQRAGLARALAVNADILLMDEPFASVDEQNRRKFQEDLLRLLAVESKTVIFVTHSIEEAVYISDQVVVLTRNPGRVSRVVRPEIDRSGDFDELRRTPAYLDCVDEIWTELKGYLEEEERTA
jgi:NitT/TauT family transport system ATP-binding protein